MSASKSKEAQSSDRVSTTSPAVKKPSLDVDADTRADVVETVLATTTITATSNPSEATITSTARPSDFSAEVSFGASVEGGRLTKNTVRRLLGASLISAVRGRIGDDTEAVGSRR